jgi:hypothetical protein
MPIPDDMKAEYLEKRKKEIEQEVFTDSLNN